MRENKIAFGEQVEEDSQPELNHSDAEERKSSSEKEEHQAVQPDTSQIHVNIPLSTTRPKKTVRMQDLPQQIQKDTQ